MSHFSRIRTQLVNKDLILEALFALGYLPQQGRFQIRSSMGDREVVTILLKAPGGHPVGLRKRGVSFEVIADWNQIEGLTQQEFINRLSQKYAYLAARQQLEAQGFTLVEESNPADGQIHMVLRRVR